MTGQRFGVADVHQAQDQLQGVDKAHARRDAALDAKTEDTGRLPLQNFLLFSR